MLNPHSVKVNLEKFGKDETTGGLTSEIIFCEVQFFASESR